MAKRTGKSKDQRQYIHNLEGQIVSLKTVISSLREDITTLKADLELSLHTKRCTPEQEAAIEAALDDSAIAHS